MKKEWFILQYKPNAHHQAAKNLKRQGFNTFLPLHNTTKRKASKFIDTSQPLFPGYMFVTFDRTESKWHKINSTYGVSSLITFNSIPRSIPNIIIDDLMTRCDSTGNILTMDNLSVGDKVKILNGPFANFVAAVESYDTDQRIWILMDFLGKRTRIQTSADYLRLVK